MEYEACATAIFGTAGMNAKVFKERFNRTQCEKVRPMLIEAGMLERMWSETARTSRTLVWK